MAVWADFPDVFAAADFIRDEREVVILTPQVPCFICRRTNPNDPACWLVTLDGERRGLCLRCYELDHDLQVSLSYETHDEGDDE